MLIPLTLFHPSLLPPCRTVSSLQDHRPVCAALDLTVDRRVRGFHVVAPLPSLPLSLPSYGSRETEKSSLADDLVLFHIYLGRPRLEGG